jgi:hypothetical protein
MVMKIKGVDLSGLTKRQISAMRRHSKHHTAKHLKSMVRAMKKGKTFTRSHTIAQRKVGR